MMIGHENQSIFWRGVHVRLPLSFFLGPRAKASLTVFFSLPPFRWSFTFEVLTFQFFPCSLPRARVLFSLFFLAFFVLTSGQAGRSLTLPPLLLTVSPCGLPDTELGIFALMIFFLSPGFRNNLKQYNFEMLLPLLRSSFQTTPFPPRAFFFSL